MQHQLVKAFNGWGSSTAVEHLGLSLKGQALEYYVDLPQKTRVDHDALCDTMAKRFSRHQSMENLVQNQLSRLRQKADECPEDLVKEVRQLTFVLYVHSGADFQQ